MFPYLPYQPYPFAAAAGSPAQDMLGALAGQIPGHTPLANIVRVGLQGLGQLASAWASSNSDSSSSSSSPAAAAGGLTRKAVRAIAPRSSTMGVAADLLGMAAEQGVEALSSSSDPQDAAASFAGKAAGYATEKLIRKGPLSDAASAAASAAAEEGVRRLSLGRSGSSRSPRHSSSDPTSSSSSSSPAPLQKLRGQYQRELESKQAEIEAEIALYKQRYDDASAAATRATERWAMRAHPGTSPPSYLDDYERLAEKAEEKYKQVREQKRAELAAFEKALGRRLEEESANLRQEARVVASSSSSSHETSSDEEASSSSSSDKTSSDEEASSSSSSDKTSPHVVAFQMPNKYEGNPQVAKVKKELEQHIQRVGQAVDRLEHLETSGANLSALLTQAERVYEEVEQLDAALERYGSRRDLPPSFRRTLVAQRPEIAQAILGPLKQSLQELQAFAAKTKKDLARAKDDLRQICSEIDEIQASLEKAVAAHERSRHQLATIRMEKDELPMKISAAKRDSRELGAKQKRLESIAGVRHWESTSVAQPLTSVREAHMRALTRILVLEESLRKSEQAEEQTRAKCEETQHTIDKLSAEKEKKLQKGREIKKWISQATAWLS